MEKPWVEKYRPKTLDEITGHEEIIKRLKNYVKKKSMPHMLFSGPPGVGKCLTGDTKVIINNKIENLGDVVEKISNGKFGATIVNNLNVLGINEDGKIKEFDVQYVYKDKTNKLIKIKTRYGRELKITPYHPLLINKEDGTIKWEKAENLKIGDKLATSRYVPFNEENPTNEYENMLSEWLGYFMGDGHADKNNNVITFTNNDENLRKRFAELTEKLFDDAKIKERIHKNRVPDIYVNSKKAIEKVGEFRGKKSHKIKIPNDVLNSSSLKYFIKAYFDCDAGVEHSSIILSTASKNMAEDLCYALAKYGIISKLKTKHNKKYGKDYYYVIISNSFNIKKFLEEIGFNQDRKYNKAKELLKNENPNLDVVAIDKSKIRYIADRLKIQFSDDKNSWGYSKTKNIGFEISKKAYYKLEEIKTLKKAINNSILIDWSEVAERRKEISEKTGIKSDRILEYIKGKRKPSLKNYIKIAKCLNVEIEDTVEAMKYFAKHYTSYAELGRIMGMWNSSVRLCLEDNTCNIDKLEEIRTAELKIINEILNDEKLTEAIAYVLFLTTNEIYWDEITDIKTLEGDFTIYDLHVPKYHNFIGGNLPTVLHNTTAALCLARDLFGENWRDNFLELNSSDERGIDVIRTKVKDFARTKPIGDAPFKIIFLDESDALTSDAQNALRRTMEKYSDICRFILSCLTENAKIYTADEREIKISDYLKLFEERKIKTVLNRNGEDLVLAGVKYNSEMVGHPVYKLTLESGKTIEATEDHKFLTNNGWMETSKLNEGDELLVYPTLEGVEYEEDGRKIINLKDFYNFLEEIELQGGYKKLGEADEFSQLTTRDKEVILNRALELYAKLHEGLTDREYEILNSIPDDGISREELQKIVGLSRTRLNQILQSIESKKYINRNINKSKKTQFIKKTSKNPIVLKNIMDIKRIIENEYNIKISYTGFKKLLNYGVRGFAQNHIKNIKERNWDKITYDSKKAGIFARLTGFIIGDGHLVKTEEKRIIITATNEELKQIINDLTELNIKCSEIMEKEITHKIDGRTVQGITSSIYIDNRTLYLLLRYWGIETGNKTKFGYNVPIWIKEGNKFVKREFIRGLFGADGTKPNIKKYNANGIKLSLRCEKEALNKTKIFFEDIKCMLKEFDIDSKLNERIIDNKYLIELTITPNDENYIKYLSKISYAYEKDNFARIVGEYLKIKSYYKNNILKEIGNNVINEIETTGNSIRKTAKKYNVSVDFVLNQMKGKKIGLPRDYMTYEQFVEHKVIDNKYVSEKIIKKECIGYKDVYDITCHNDHSFIANGFVSHNCNYPSRIIPPIQSRCAIFRFSPLKREDIIKKLKEIAENENITIDDSGIDAIIYVSEGDLRKAINVLQTAATVSKNIDDEVVYKVSSKARPDEIRKMVELALNNKFIEARELLYNLMIDWGMSGEDILIQMFREIPNLDIEERKKVSLVEAIGECDFRIVEGANERIQLSALLAKIGMADNTNL